MTAPIIGLIAFVVIALVGWGIAELKGKMVYEHSEEEAKELEEMAEHDKEFGTEEMDIHKLVKNNCTTGYKAV